MVRGVGAAVVISIALCLQACAPAQAPRPLLPAVQSLETAVQALQTADLPWPRSEVWELASRAYRCAASEGSVHRSVLTVIDYSLPSNERRLWVIDMLHRRVLHHELVAHGEGSGAGAMAVAFSNEVGSHQSSLGLFRTDEVYMGRFGYSLRLSGLEPRINDRARERAIVVHGDVNVSDSVASRWGMVGPSWGCPALATEVAPRVIDNIAGGSAIFAYYPDSKWMSESRYLNCAQGPY